MSMHRCELSSGSLVTVISLVAACGASSSSPAQRSSPAPVPAVAPAPAHEAPIPRFGWPDQTVLEVRSRYETVNTAGTTDRSEGHYLLAYEELPDGDHRFWEAGSLEAPTEVMHRAMNEVGVYPSLRLGADSGELRVAGLDAWLERMSSTPMLQGSDPELVGLRGYLTPGSAMGAHAVEEMILEWYFIAGMWKHALLPFRLEVRGLDGELARDSGPTTIKLDNNKGDVGGWSLKGTITFGPTDDHIHVEMTYGGTGQLLPMHFHMLLAPAHHALAEQARHELVLTVDSDRATMLPIRSRAEWRVTVTDAQGVEHVGRNLVDKTYRRTGWDSVRWEPLD